MRRGRGSGVFVSGLDVAVVGAGVAGLATALSFARRGAHVRVYERADALREFGAGIQISPNGMAVLAGLGADQAVRSAGLPAEAVELRREEDDAIVVRLDLSGRDWILIHRAALLRALADAASAAGVDIVTAAEVTALADEADTARISFVDGSQAKAALVVGADGLHGSARSRLGGGAAAKFTGQVAWRALVPGDAPAVAEVHMGRGRHVVTYPLAGGARNIVAVREAREWTADGWSIRGDPDELRAAFAGVSPRLKRLLRQVEAAHVWGLHLHPVAETWHGRRIALAGDAAHPTLPFLAQGANMALEDAWALADCVDAAPLEAALPAYQRRRVARARRTVAAADRNAWVYHLRPGLHRAALHAGLRLGEALRPGAGLRRFDWLYRHDETKVSAN